MVRLRKISAAHRRRQRRICVYAGRLVRFRFSLLCVVVMTIMFLRAFAPRTTSKSQPDSPGPAASAANLREVSTTAPPAVSTNMATTGTTTTNMAATTSTNMATSSTSTAPLPPTDIETKLRALVRQAKEGINDTVPFSEITKLDLSNLGLTELDLEDEYPSLLPNLSILFLSNNNFKTMPAVIGQFPKLQMVSLKGNGLQTIHPDALQPQLRWLILTSNEIQTIPETIGRCTKLQKCMLSDNQLKELPASMSNCQHIELIRLATNQLAEPPMHILQLPNLRWVALANNPFLKDLQIPNSLLSDTPTITDLDESAADSIIVGQGASGITKKMMYQGQPVAVKTYGSAMTSDGLPEDERKISVAASTLNCTALIHVLGASETTGSLVMEFLQGYQGLAGPPSLETCSRDVYASEQHFSGREAVHLVTVLLDALQQLHAVNITHGDFYGHNILIRRGNRSDAEGQAPTDVRLSDFGAAFFYDGESEYGKLLETIELRAFAVLVAEVTLRVTEAIPFHAQLNALHEACLQDGATLASIDAMWKQQQIKSEEVGVDNGNAK